MSSRLRRLLSRRAHRRAVAAVAARRCRSHWLSMSTRHRRRRHRRRRLVGASHGRHIRMRHVRPQ